jgi:hypothetical protein
MTSFSEVLDLAKNASEALNALEATAHARVLSFFGRHQNGFETAPQLREEMLRQAKAGFAAAGSIALEHIQGLAESAGLPAVDVKLLTKAPVLDRLTNDIVRNFNLYMASSKTETDLRRLQFRTGLSVQQAVRRGFTENQIAAAAAIRDQGASLKKIWLANFVDNVPCRDCKALHGTEVSLSAEFPHGDEKSPKIFHGLQGPPRHPNCHCYMLVYVITLGTIPQVPKAPVLDEQKFMTSKDVRRLPRSVFTAAITTLRLISGKLKGAFRGKR